MHVRAIEAVTFYKHVDLLVHCGSYKHCLEFLLLSRKFTLILVIIATTAPQVVFIVKMSQVVENVMNFL